MEVKHKSVSLILILLIFCANPVSAETLVVTTLRESNPLAKVAVLIMDNIYEKLGYRVKIRYAPPKRSLIDADMGKFDADLARIKGVEERFPNLIRIPVPIYRLEGLAFTKNKHFTIEGWESLRPYKIGVMRGVQFAELGTENLDRELRCSLEELFRMLNAERLDIVVEAKLNGIIKIKQLNLHNSIQVLTPPIVTMDLFHYVHEKNKHLVPKLTDLLIQMKQDGSLDELIRQSEQTVIRTMMRDTSCKE